MTKEHADEILTYVAQEIISPMAFDTRPASEYWEECIGEKFNKLCKIVRKGIDKSTEM